MHAEVLKARQYLQAYPSTSYTLANLGRYFPEFLMQTRPVDTTAEAILPGPSSTYLVITRRDYMVRRCRVSHGEYELLSVLVAGETIGDAIERAATAPGMDLDSLAAQLQQWFAAWAKAAYFQKIELPD